MNPRSASSCIVVLAILMVLTLGTFSAVVHAYDTATGTKPELQAKQTLSSSTKAVSLFEVVRDGSDRYADISDILEDLFSISSDELSGLDDDVNQIVIGDVSDLTIANLAALLCVNTVDLGEEGYVIVSKENPRSTNGSWIVLIVAASGCSDGVLNGIYTFIDLVEDSGPSVIGDHYIRDYPDSPFRAVFHWIPRVEDSGSSWVTERVDSLEKLEGKGCNAIHLGAADFWEMDSTHYNGLTADGLHGRWINEFAYNCRQQNLEPIPQLWAAPYRVRIWHPLWREGEFIEDEVFNIEYDTGEEKYFLEPAITPFDNAAYDMDFSTWTSWSSNWNQPTGWTLNSTNGYLSYSGNTFVGPSQTFDASEFSPGSFYVLETKVSDVSTVEDGAIPMVYVMVHLGEPYNDWITIFFEVIADCEGEATRDYFFWTPPTFSGKPSDYPTNDYEDFPLWDYIDQVSIKIYTQPGPSTCSMNLHSFFLERRASALRNVMIDEGNGLDVEIKDELRSTCSTGDYSIIEPDTLFSYRMLTHRYNVQDDLVNNLTRIEWTAQDIPDSVFVSYTAGVPHDWTGEGQMTTYCLRNEEYLEYMEDVLETYYKSYTVDVNGVISYALNPKYIDVRLDEVRGTNRCGRCEGYGCSNGEHFTEYLNELRSMLAGLVSQYPAAAETKFIVSANMLSPWRNGDNPAYQFQYGGPWGAMESDVLADLNTPGCDLIFTMTHVDESEDARDAGWPQSAGALGQDNLYVVGGMSYETGADPDFPEDWAVNSTWYADDAMGFTSLGYNENHYDSEYRLIDYAWKKYANPDATLQAHINTYTFVTDETVGRTVEIDEGETVVFKPFGTVEMRDEDTDHYQITAATMDWDEMLPPSVSSILNSGSISHTFNADGTFDVELEVEAQPNGSGTPITATATITVEVEDSDPDPPSPGGKDNPFQTVQTPIPEAYALHQNSPNPFNPITKITFDLPVQSMVSLSIYNVKGEIVRTLVNEQLPAGYKKVAWNGKDNNGSTMASGVYFYRIVTEGLVATKKMILLR
ncbi:MAG: T9SS type A sorting domain-containing protein [Bacteroidales bacterium]|nr:T9SS type A sorting domain-containing protein [Candidatus Latescibacterota bacterium]